MDLNHKNLIVIFNKLIANNHKKMDLLQGEWLGQKLEQGEGQGFANVLMRGEGEIKKGLV